MAAACIDCVPLAGPRATHSFVDASRAPGTPGWHTLRTACPASCEAVTIPIGASICVSLQPGASPTQSAA
eukprot:scaffold218754_cov36-Tisochrysis_lutea.AAC.2